MSEFHFAAARITAAQICRAAGLERTVPSVLDAFTDILIQYFMLLGSTARDAAESRGSSEADADDAMLAAVECSALRGGLQSTQFQNFRQTSWTGIEDIIELSNWLRGPENARMVAVARPQRPMSTATIGAAQGAALAALPSSAAAASQFGADANHGAGGLPLQPLPSRESDPNAQKTAAAGSAPVQTEAPAPEAQQDWLRIALNRHILMGHHDWFVNTELGPHKDPDPTIYGANVANEL